MPLIRFHYLIALTGALLLIAGHAGLAAQDMTLESGQFRTRLMIEDAEVDAPPVIGLTGMFVGDLPLTGADEGVRFALRIAGRDYDRFQPLRIRREEQRLTQELTVVGHPSARLEIQMEPVSQTLDGREFTGARYRYAVSGLDLGGCEIIEDSQWRPGGRKESLCYFIYNVYGPTEYRPADKVRLDTRAGQRLHSRFGKMQPFDYIQVRGGGALLMYFDRPALILNGTHAAPGEVPINTDHYFLVEPEMASPWKYVLWSDDSPPATPVEELNEYLAVTELMSNRYCELLGFERPISRPYLWLGPRLEKIWPMLPQLKQYGFTRIDIGPIWKSSATEGGQRASMSVYNLDIADQWGGLEGLRAFCAEAHRHGIEVNAWFAFMHLSDESPLLKQHPDWIARSAYRKPYEGKLLPLDLSNPQVKEYVLEKLRIVREAGVDGLWLDSYHSLAIEVVQAHGAVQIPQVDHVLKLQMEMQKMGFAILIEGWGPFGITSCGIIGNRPKVYRDHEYRALRMSPWLRGRSQTDPGLEYVNYFRFLAFGGSPRLNSHMFANSEPFYNFSEQQLADLTNWHRAFNRVTERLTGPPIILPDEQGVMWKGEDDDIIFSFTDGTIELRAADAQVEDLTTDEIRTVSGLQAPVLKERVYEVRYPAGSNR